MLINVTDYFSKYYANNLDLHPFPTRRSSDLDHRLAAVGVSLRYRSEGGYGAWQLRLPANGSWVELELPGSPYRVPRRFRDRSEEHTSELQSHVNLVCRLLLEKKKKTKHN